MWFQSIIRLIMTTIVVFIKMADVFVVKKHQQILMRQNKSIHKINYLWLVLFIFSTYTHHASHNNLGASKNKSIFYKFKKWLICFFLFWCNWFPPGQWLWAPFSTMYSAIAKSSWEVCYNSPSEMTNIICCKTAHPTSSGKNYYNTDLFYYV